MTHLPFIDATFRLAGIRHSRLAIGEKKARPFAFSIAGGRRRARPFGLPFCFGNAEMLNVTQFASTFIWQRRLQAEMAETGYDEAKTRLLLSTNWIRTVGFLGQAVLATMIVVRALAHL